MPHPVLVDERIGREQARAQHVPRDEPGCREAGRERREAFEARSREPGPGPRQRRTMIVLVATVSGAPNPNCWEAVMDQGMNRRRFLGATIGTGAVAAGVGSPGSAAFAAAAAGGG